MISFVGAGPGDIELLTLKGKKRLQEADAVIYDRLVNPLLLFYCKPDCVFLYVGKTPYQSSMQQETINQLLLDTQKNHSKIVRLKGGTPEIFGRLTEELEVVSGNNIAFEIIPGVSSAGGSVAYNGIPLTERGQARAVTFMTAHLKMNEEVLLPEHSAEQTLCIYMGIEALPKLILQLVNQGFSANTKIAVISWGTYGRQKKVCGTFSTIEGLIAKERVKNPAMILIGEVVSNERRFNWFEQLPAFGKRYLLVSTRSPTIDELIHYTSAGADIWWHQVGEMRDKRFDPISGRYLSEQQFEEVKFIDSTSEKLFCSLKKGE